MVMDGVGTGKLGARGTEAADSEGNIKKDSNNAGKHSYFNKSSYLVV